MQNFFQQQYHPPTLDLPSAIHLYLFSSIPWTVATGQTLLRCVVTKAPRRNMSLRHLLLEDATGLSTPFSSSGLLMFWEFLQAFLPAISRPHALPRLLWDSECLDWEQGWDYCAVCITKRIWNLELTMSLLGWSMLQWALLIRLPLCWIAAEVGSMAWARLARNKSAKMCLFQVPRIYRSLAIAA